MIEWLQYFFGSFFSNRLARQCQWRSMGNTALGALLAFLLLVCGLTWGYQAAFPAAYRGAEEFRGVLYETLEQTGLTVKNGTAQGSEEVYDAELGGYRCTVDLRDTQGLYDDFTLMCRSETGAEISYEAYLAQPAHVQKEYDSFTVEYSGQALDLEAGYEAWYDYLLSVTADAASPLYQQETAQALAELEEDRPEDYYGQIYLLYVKAYYPQLSLREYGAAAPTVHGYYLDRIAGDTQGKILAIFRDQCYIGFLSQGRRVFFVGDYSGIDSLPEGEAGADTLVRSVFRSGAQADYLMYTVNVFGMFILVIAAWLVLMILVRLICRKRHIEEGGTFGSAAQLVGSFLLGSGLVAAAGSFLLSFLVSQDMAYYAAAVLTLLTLVLRTAGYLAQK